MAGITWHSGIRRMFFSSAGRASVSRHSTTLPKTSRNLPTNAWIFPVTVSCRCVLFPIGVRRAYPCLAGFVVPTMTRREGGTVPQPAKRHWYLGAKCHQLQHRPLIRIFPDASGGRWLP
jgi:hypothetical protein